MFEIGGLAIVAVTGLVVVGVFATMIVADVRARAPWRTIGALLVIVGLSQPLTGLGNLILTGTGALISIVAIAIRLVGKTTNAIPLRDLTVDIATLVVMFVTVAGSAVYWLGPANVAIGTSIELPATTVGSITAHNVTIEIPSLPERAEVEPIHVSSQTRIHVEDEPGCAGCVAKRVVAIGAHTSDVTLHIHTRVRAPRYQLHQVAAADLRVNAEPTVLPDHLLVKFDESVLVDPAKPWEVIRRTVRASAETMVSNGLMEWPGFLIFSANRNQWFDLSLDCAAGRDCVDHSFALVRASDRVERVDVTATAAIFGTFEGDPELDVDVAKPGAWTTHTASGTTTLTDGRDELYFEFPVSGIPEGTALVVEADVSAEGGADEWVDRGECSNVACWFSIHPAATDQTITWSVTLHWGFFDVDTPPAFEWALTDPVQRWSLG